MSPLTEGQINSFMEKIGEVFDVPLFTKTDTNRLLTLAKESVQWEAGIKQQLTKAGLPISKDQIALLPCNVATNNSILSVQALAPLFSLFNVDVSKANLTNLIDKIVTVVSNRPLIGKECVNYTAPFPRDFYILDEVKTLRPEYFVGTWFNRQENAFKIDMELDWVNRMVYGKDRYMPERGMSTLLYSSTGEHIWDFVSEVHIHRTAMLEFTRPRDGWILAPDADPYSWKFEANDSPLNCIQRMTKLVKGERTILQLGGGMGGWATFEAVSNSDVTAAAARLLFKFSDPLYYARSDGKVVIKFKNSACKAIMVDKSKFPSGRTLVTDHNKFPSSIY